MTRKDIDELIQAKKARSSEIQILSREIDSVYNAFRTDYNITRFKIDDEGNTVTDENGDFVIEEIPYNELNSDDKALRDGYNMAIEDLCKLIAKI